MMRPVVVFGAGSGAAKVIATLKNVGVKICAVTDNNESKWGTTFCDLKVIPPLRLKEIDCDIIVASVYQNEIEEQLREYGVLERLVVKERYISDYIENHMDEFAILKQTKIDYSKERDIVMGLDYGTLLGGIETLAFMWSKEFQKRGKQVSLLTIKTEGDIPQELQQSVEYYEEDFEHYFDTIKQIAGILAGHLPCVLIDNWEGTVLMAASVIKRIFPEAIRVVSVIHNDRSFLYRRTAYMESYMDAIAGVSQSINEHLNSEFGISKDKLFYHPSPVAVEPEIQRNYTLDTDKPLQIGYAARIFKSQKRADLLVPLMLQMNKDGVYYHLHIAGDGEYFEKLKQEVINHKVEKYCTLYGCIPRETIRDFWKDKDVFINLSDYEGVGLSMLEAMGCGVVPIETRVAGCYEFIEHGVNGYIVDLQDIQNMSRCIKGLEINRNCLPKMGAYNHELILNKCDPGEYIDYMLTLCQA